MHNSVRWSDKCLFVAVARVEIYKKGSEEGKPRSKAYDQPNGSSEMGNLHTNEGNEKSATFHEQEAKGSLSWSSFKRNR